MSEKNKVQILNENELSAVSGGTTSLRKTSTPHIQSVRWYASVISTAKRTIMYTMSGLVKYWKSSLSIRKAFFTSWNQTSWANKLQTHPICSFGTNASSASHNLCFLLTDIITKRNNSICFLSFSSAFTCSRLTWPQGLRIRSAICISVLNYFKQAE